MKYIAEIDGLRAVAVMTVILHHFGFSLFSGGFVGVDVFFVISGFLITSILITETDKSTLNFFKEFYIRRALRLFPALFFVVLVTLAISYFLLVPGDYSELGRSAIATVGFFSNIYFNFNTGYFDGPAVLMPLLHTWSLGVEEQFYIIWPTLILILAKSTNRVCLLIVILLFLSSFLGSALMTESNPSLTFYNIPFRFFEFLLGAVIPIFFSSSKIRRRCNESIAIFLQAFGIFLISFSAVNFSSEDNFPGFLALVPSLGSALFIFGVVTTTSRKLNPLGSRPVAFIGKISYSLYLWHWPVIVLFTIYNSEMTPNLIQRIGLLLGTFVVSIFSYFLIETPFRRPAKSSLSLKVSASFAILIIACSAAVIISKGAINRMSGAETVMTAKQLWKWDCPNKLRVPELSNRRICNFGVPWKDASRRIILWGDSHAEQIAPLLGEIAKEHKLSVLLFKACPPYVNGDEVFRKHKNPRRATAGCKESRSKGLDYIENDPLVKLVIFTAAWRYSPNQIYSADITNPNNQQAIELMKLGLDDTIETLAKFRQIDVLILGDIPHPLKTRKGCDYHDSLWRTNAPDCFPLSMKYVNRIHGPSEEIMMAAKVHRNVYTHSVIDHHCKGEGCPIYINDRYLYRDGGHIIRNANIVMKQGMIESFGFEKAIDWQAYASE